LAIIVHKKSQMPTASHFSPMNPVLLDTLEDDPALRLVTDVPSDDPGGATVLATAFSEFIAAAGRLEASYRQLQEEVAGLRLELAEQNAALNHSLAENERMHLQLQQIVDSMPCGVLVLDTHGAISMINPESLRLLALDSARSHTLHLREIAALQGIHLHPSPNGHRGQEVCIHYATGKRWVEMRSRRLVHAETPGAEQTVLILRDVTAQRRDQQEREAARKAMALAEMTTVLAHEIRNPLASLELFAELIENDADHRAAWISNLRAGIRSLSATANNVLSFHGSGTLKLSPVPLAALIERAIEFVQPLADQAAVSLAWLSAHDRSVVLGNDCALQQVFLNLVSNAIRHTPAGGSVTISVRAARKSDEVMVEFADTGSGIRPDQAKDIFEPGFSGSGDTSGLGLAVCRMIMKQHHGSIALAPGGPAGARFELHFPLLSRERASA
jgi:two-component system sensor histidine kinase FlrB